MWRNDDALSFQWELMCVALGECVWYCYDAPWVGERRRETRPCKSSFGMPMTLLVLRTILCDVSFGGGIEFYMAFSIILDVVFFPK